MTDSLRDEIQETSERLRLVQGFVDHPFWGEFAAWLEEQYRARHATVLHQPLAGVDGVLAQEFLKGEASGLYSAWKWPNNLREELSTRLAELTEEEDDDDLQAAETPGGDGRNPERLPDALDESNNPYGR